MKTHQKSSLMALVLCSLATYSIGTAVAAPLKPASPAIAPAPAVVVDYSNGWETLDGAKVQATFASDGVYVDPQVPQGLVGNAIAARVESFKGYRVTIDSYDFLADGRARTFWTVIDPQGKLAAKGHDHFTLVGGKIARMEAFFDAQ